MLTASARLGSYEIVALLAASGMGEVYRAKDTKLGRDVALKILPHEAGKTHPARVILKTSTLYLVRCENPVRQLGHTPERHRRDDRGAECADRRMPTPSKLVAVAPVAPATTRDVAGACCNDRRTREGSAQGGPGSELATGRNILSGPSPKC
jgi:serine/threonine protein kinase